MEFGLTGAPTTFHHAMSATLALVLRKCSLFFFDNILIYRKTYSEHIQHLAMVLTILQQDKWQVKLLKCAFAQQRIAYLGHIISALGVATDDTKIHTIQNWPTPVNLKELRGFLGLSGYYRKFIKHYAIISQTLSNLLKKVTLFIWTDASEIVSTSVSLARFFLTLCD